MCSGVKACGFVNSRNDPVLPFWMDGECHGGVRKRVCGGVEACNGKVEEVARDFLLGQVTGRIGRARSRAFVLISKLDESSNERVPGAGRASLLCYAVPKMEGKLRLRNAHLLRGSWHKP